ncbi:hypothetical protein [Mycobacterium lepromatosis]|uniref:hypothetical protein n=1 Tax=Mycobacterium lepromatosis TaxID=480418 RepID=UPI0006798987|nr:hypothetical protein [Mycobacterium lepromatosis]
MDPGLAGLAFAAELVAPRKPVWICHAACLTFVVRGQSVQLTIGGDHPSRVLVSTSWVVRYSAFYRYADCSGR